MLNAPERSVRSSGRKTAPLWLPTSLNRQWVSERSKRNWLMLLVIDVGNTNTSLGVYRQDELVAHWRLTTNPARTIDEYGVHSRNLFELARLDFTDIEAIAVASVVPPLNYTVKRMAEVYFHLTPLFIDHTTDTGLRILYEPASEVGAE